MTTKDRTLENRHRIRSRLKLVIIIFLFLGPLLFSFLWYYGFGAAHAPAKQLNHAPLVSPIIAVKDFNNDLYGSGRVSFSSFKKMWTVVHFVGSQCENQCQKSIYNTRQTRIAIGKDVLRVQRFIVLETDRMAVQLQANHPDAKLLKVGNSGLEKQLKALTKNIKNGVDDALLVDPLGNIMMLIPVGLDPSLLLKDLKKLLKLSHIG